MGVNDVDLQELDALDTLSLTDFLLTKDRDSDFHDHTDDRARPSPATKDSFEFRGGGSIELPQEHMMMVHAEDMISGGKLIPIKDHEKCTGRHISRERRCESMRELKTTTNKGTANRLARNSYSFDHKNRNSLSNKSSSSRWSDLVFGPLKGPPEMDLRDIRNRQVIQNTSKSLFPAVEASDHVAVRRVSDHRKSSWGVLGFLSCKSSGSVAVRMTLR